MQRVHIWRRRAIWTTSIAALACASFAAAAETGPKPIRAVWQVQELRLTYMGFTSHYSCDGMREKIARWVKQLAPHENSKITIAGCDNPTGVAHMPSVRIVLATPIAADAAGEITKDPKRAEAIAKLQHKGKAPFEDGSFDAVRTTVALLSKDYSEGIGGAGDCEMLENFRDQVIKKIDARIVSDHLGCFPHQGNVGNPQLTVEALTKVPQ
jgi:hypothetical protein